MAEKDLDLDMIDVVQDDDEDLSKQDRGDVNDAPEPKDEGKAGGEGKVKQYDEEALRKIVEEEDAVPGKKEGEGEPEGKKQRFSEVPKWRLAQMLERERAKREQLEALIAERAKQQQDEAQKQAEKENAEKRKALEEEIDGLVERHAKAIADGDTKAAKELMRQIRAKDRELDQIDRAPAAPVVDAERIKDDLQYDALVDELEETFSVLNPDSEDYDADLVAEILFVKDALVAKGMRHSTALSRAVNYVLLPLVEDDGEEGEKKAEGLKAGKAGDRKAEAVKKAIDAASRQAPDLTNVGDDHDKTGGKIPKATELTDEDLAALPESVLKKMRGDFV